MQSELAHGFDDGANDRDSGGFSSDLREFRLTYPRAYFVVFAAGRLLRRRQYPLKALNSWFVRHAPCQVF